MQSKDREALFHGARNDRWLDVWSLGHLVLGVGLGWVIDPFWALVILILWEPFEIIVVGPLVWRVAGVTFGHESWKNAMSDVLVDALGVALGAFVLLPRLDPPF